MLDLRSLARPVVQAPMAGGPSTPELAAAVGRAGGLGSLAAGYRTVDQLAGDIAAARSQGSAPLCVNLFVPQPSTARPDRLAEYRRELESEAQRYDADLPDPTWDDDDWAAKLELLADDPVDVVSFAFGCPDPAIIRRLQERGSGVMVSVTSADEARLAAGAGADLLCVQGPEAGGHRAAFDTTQPPPTLPLQPLLAAVRAATDLPLVASGGLMGAADVAAVLGLGAVAAQCGTAYLRCPEAATRQPHRLALSSPDFDRTGVTRAFSGRYARGLLNRFMRQHDATAPVGYPEINTMTGPLRRAAAAAGDPHGINLWAGVGFRQATDLPAAEVTGLLTP